MPLGLQRIACHACRALQMPAACLQTSTCTCAPDLQDVGGCGLKNSVRHKLLRPPRVFTLQLGWQSQQEEPHSIAATLAAVDEMVRC